MITSLSALFLFQDKQLASILIFISVCSYEWVVVSVEAQCTVRMREKGYVIKDRVEDRFRPNV